MYGAGPRASRTLEEWYGPQGTRYDGGMERTHDGCEPTSPYTMDHCDQFSEPIQVGNRREAVYGEISEHDVPGQPFAFTAPEPTNSMGYPNLAPDGCVHSPNKSRLLGSSFRISGGKIFTNTGGGDGSSGRGPQRAKRRYHGPDVEVIMEGMEADEIAEIEQENAFMEQFSRSEENLRAGRRQAREEVEAKGDLIDLSQDDPEADL